MESVSARHQVVRATDQKVVSRQPAADGLAPGMAADAVHVSTTTCSPGCSEEISILRTSAGENSLAAPVLGRPHVALAGQLVSTPAWPGIWNA
jgi:3-hydroxyisobutyrate dehydrogenase-like beta-hydroxyacid dehydrogenase